MASDKTDPRSEHDPPPVRPPPEQDLADLIHYSHIFSSVVRELLEIKLLRRVSPAPLTLSQFHILKLVSVNGHHQVGEVADYLGVSSAAATKNVDKLERLGLLNRTPSQEDRRAILLTSSAAGRRLVRRYEALKEERLAPVLAAFTAKELSQLSRLVERFSVSLLETDEDVDGVCLRCSAYYDDHCAIRSLDVRCPYVGVRSDRAAASRRRPARVRGGG